MILAKNVPLYDISPQKLKTIFFIKNPIGTFLVSSRCSFVQKISKPYARFSRYPVTNALTHARTEEREMGQLTFFCTACIMALLAAIERKWYQHQFFAQSNKTLM